MEFPSTNSQLYQDASYFHVKVILHGGSCKSHKQRMNSFPQCVTALCFLIKNYCGCESLEVAGNTGKARAAR